LETAAQRPSAAPAQKAKSRKKLNRELRQSRIESFGIETGTPF
jgi:hypothetical protein